MEKEYLFTLCSTLIKYIKMLLFLFISPHDNLFKKLKTGTFLDQKFGLFKSCFVRLIDLPKIQSKDSILLQPYFLQMYMDDGRRITNVVKENFSNSHF